MKNIHPKAIFLTILLMGCSVFSQTHDFTTVFENSNFVETPTYPEVIRFYKKLDSTYNSIKVYTMRETDSGFPLHLVLYNPKGVFPNSFPAHFNKNIVLINNGIHPGESDGIDASMLLIRDLAQHTIKSPKNTIIAVIPVYNIGGALNRNSTSRTNQNGPVAYGFRGNARNFDLNRDFIKSDTKNARSFAAIFHALNPQVFIDTHVSNGADYQYTLTHLFTQHNKLGGEPGKYLHQVLQPALETALADKDLAITPYVNIFNKSPEVGFSQFLDSPRYSTGYTTLFGTLGMMIETHMLKPYKQRVYGTYELLKSMLEIVDKDALKIKKITNNAHTNYRQGAYYPVSWTVDSSKVSKIAFKGYEATFPKSEITGVTRLKFDRTKPYTRPVSYYNYFKPKDSVSIPKAYVIPKGWWPVIDLLKINNIAIRTVTKDTLLEVEKYTIKNYDTAKSAYEGHYLHYNTQVDKTTETILVKKGDYIVHTAQKGIRYILETLEPQAVDSFFNWNFFDTILQQKEGFSPYVWEDKALAFLTANPSIKKAFEDKKKTDANFAKNWYAQLDWIHKKSPNYEQSHLRYPIFRVGG